jgi:hypothetical protein
MGNRLKGAPRRKVKMSDPTDDFEAHIHAIGRVDDALRLLLRDFTGQGYSANDVIVMCRVVLARLEHEGEGLSCPLATAKRPAARHR